MSVRAVFFDVDDTLIDYQHAARTAFQHAHGADADYDAFSALDHHMLFDDALACLAALRERDIRIALITNNEGTHQRAKTAAVGLDRLVDIAVISGDLGFRSPIRASSRTPAPRSTSVRPTRCTSATTSTPTPTGLMPRA